MIAQLTGITNVLNPSECIIDVSGVGYHLYIPFTTYENIRHGEKAVLYVYTLHKEDQFKLYGFHTLADREFFAVLLNISGVGSSMALSILSGISVERFVDAVQNDRSDMLTNISGIGKSKAEKIIFEAKKKVKKLRSISSENTEETYYGNDAIEALIALGFEDKKAAAAIKAVQSEFPEATVEKRIKEALKILSV